LRGIAWPLELAHYDSLRAAASLPHPDAKVGTHSKTVHVPKANVFSPDALRRILQRISQQLSP
jgi:hypothetical protein